jgi:uncharacterized protein
VRTRVAGALVGVVFGVTLSWTGLSSPVVIRQGLLFQRAYLFLFFASAVAVALVGQQLLRRARVRALLTGERVGWAPEAPQRRHLVGSVLFGLGWGLADACPGPIATQVGQGVAWSLFTIAGVVGGIVLARRGLGSFAGVEALQDRGRRAGRVQPAGDDLV